MNYILVPSLGQIALVKIAVTLWNQDDIKTRITNYSSLLPRNKRGPLSDGGIDLSEQCKWTDIQEKVSDKVKQLGLPECLKEKLSGVVKPIGLELINCIEYHYRYINGKSCGLPNNLCWTSLGKVDKKKTAAVLIKENIHIVDRYILACNYCLENDIKELWKSMTRSIKDYVCGDEHVLNYECDQLVVIWTYALRGQIARLNDRLRSLRMSPSHFGFKLASSSGNKPATEYFLKRLNPVEREECLMRYECKTHYSDVLCFLLSQMNEKEQITFLSKNAYDVLRCLLEWPLQSFFKETFVKVCNLNLLQGEGFYALLEDIMTKINGLYPHEDFNYKILLEQIWLLSPYSYKEYVILYWGESKCVMLMREMTIEGNIMLILNDATIQERENIIFNNVDCLTSLVCDDDWTTIKLLIEECVSSTEMMIKLKNEFIADMKDFGAEFSGSDSTDPQFEKYICKVNRFMDELIKKKRSIEEVECGQSKRPRTMKLEDCNVVE